MRRTSAVLSGAVAALVLGCTVSRQGTLQTLPSGPVIPVTVAVEGDAVVVHGQNPATGEVLEGRLARVPQGRTGSGGWYPNSGGAVTPLPSGMGAAGGGTEKTIDVSGVLEGDQGTRLRCTAQVERRLRLAGGGICRVEGPIDNAPTFRLRF